MRLPGAAIHHVSAHQGHPWNECADSLAKWAAGHPPGFFPHARIQRLIYLIARAPVHDMEWEAAVELYRGTHALPGDGQPGSA
eukprot:1984079-Lingulodinium_polyedra.AAC.1